jgi:hypothetical protein
MNPVLEGVTAERLIVLATRAKGLVSLCQYTFLFSWGAELT